MSDEKIDLAELERQVAYEKAYAGDNEFMDDVLALVAAVRAARKLAPRVIPQSIQGREFLAALAPFTDSAEVRSDA